MEIYTDLNELRDGTTGKMKYQMVILAVTHLLGLTLLWLILFFGSIVLEQRFGIPSTLSFIGFFFGMLWGGKQIRKLANDTCAIFYKQLYKKELATIHWILGMYVTPKVQREHSGIRQKVHSAIRNMKEGDCPQALLDTLWLLEKHHWLFEKIGPVQHVRPQKVHPWSKSS